MRKSQQLAQGENYYARSSQQGDSHSSIGGYDASPAEYWIALYDVCRGSMKVRSWHIASFRYAAEFGRHRGITDIGKSLHQSSSIYEYAPWFEEEDLTETVGAVRSRADRPGGFSPMERLGFRAARLSQEVRP
jgi:hypothetical protein